MGKRGSDLIGITSVKPQEDYKLFLTFSNGKKGIFDVEPYLDKGIFKQLRDPAMFRTVSTDDYPTICWANGADLCPDCVYLGTKFI